MTVAATELSVFIRTSMTFIESQGVRGIGKLNSKMCFVYKFFVCFLNNQSLNVGTFGGSV